MKAFRHFLALVFFLAAIASGVGTLTVALSQPAILIPVGGALCGFLCYFLSQEPKS